MHPVAADVARTMTLGEDYAWAGQPRSWSIHGAANNQASSIDAVGANHRGSTVLVAEEFLHSADAVVILQ